MKCKHKRGDYEKSCFDIRCFLGVFMTCPGSRAVCNRSEAGITVL